MPVYTIVERRPAIAIWEYIVEAETEAEAMDKVLSQELIKLEVDHTTEVDYELEAEYEVFIDEDEA